GQQPEPDRGRLCRRQRACLEQAAEVDTWGFFEHRVSLNCKTSLAKSRFGVFGLAVMGQNLARNLAHHGVPVAVHNRTYARTELFVEAHGSEGDFTPSRDVAEFVNSIERPRPILLMVKAGEAVDQSIAELEPHLQPGDILIDGGNSYFGDTRRRTAA